MPVNPERLRNSINVSLTDAGRYLSQQLMRSGLSAAANYAEARAAESRADFIHKLRIVLKELNESKSWLEQRWRALIAENKELCWISPPLWRGQSNLRLRISDLRCRIGPISDSSERWMSQVY